MKKIVLVLVAMLSMTTVFAENTEKNGKTQKAPEVTVATMNNNYDMSIKYRSLASKLELNDYQREAVQLIHNKFVTEMRNAQSANDAERKGLVKKASDKELQYMGYVLNDKQYNMFSTLLSLTLGNRGLLD